MDFDKQPELKKPVTRNYNIVAEWGGQEQKHAFFEAKNRRKKKSLKSWKRRFEGQGRKEECSR